MNTEKLVQYIIMFGICTAAISFLAGKEMLEQFPFQYGFILGVSIFVVAQTEPEEVRNEARVGGLIGGVAVYSLVYLFLL